MNRDLSSSTEMKSNEIRDNIHNQEEDWEVFTHPPKKISKYDYCLVFRLINKPYANHYQLDKDAIDIISKLIFYFSPKCIYQYNTTKKDETLRYVLIHLSSNKAKYYAELVQYHMLLNKSLCDEKLARGEPKYLIEPIQLPSKAIIKDCENYIYVKYKSDNILQELYTFTNHFPNKVRIHLIEYILENNDQYGGGMGLNLTALLHFKKLIAYYPIHRRTYIYYLEQSWISIFKTPWNQPYEDINSYFNTKIALYFQFIEFLLQYLFPLICIGICFQIAIISLDNYNLFLIGIYAILLILSCIFLDILWKRQISYYSYCWRGHTLPTNIQYTENYFVRPDFIGYLDSSDIDGKPTIKYDEKNRYCNYIQTIIITIYFIIIIIAIIISIYILHAQLTSNDTHYFKQWIISFINGLWIVIFNSIIFRVAWYLTIIENHRLESSFQHSFQFKVILLQFLNSYGSIYYLAYIAMYMNNIPITSNSSNISNYINSAYRNKNMLILVINILAIYSMRLLKNSCHVIYLYQFFLNRRSYIFNSNNKQVIEDNTSTTFEFNDVYSTISEVSDNLDDSYHHRDVLQSKSIYYDNHAAERDYEMKEFNITLQDVKLYSDILLSLGYLLIFGCILPGISLLVAIDLYLIYKRDAFRLMHIYRRYCNHIIGSSKDISNWVFISFYFLIVASILSNTGLIIFVSDIFLFLSLVNRIWLFVCCLIIFSIIRLIFIFLIPTIPTCVQLQITRNQVITAKLIDKIPDVKIDARSML